MRTAWITRGAIALAIAAIALLAVGGVAGSTQSGCVRCHTTVHEASQERAHADVGCLSCHAPGSQRIAFTAEQWLRMYPASLAGKSPSGSVREVPRQNCLSCHREVLNQKSTGDLLGVKIVHKSCAPGASCDSCHSTTAHGSAVRWERRPVMEDCTACHRREKAPVECDTCHVGRLKGDRLQTGPWQVTHGRKWRQTHGMGDLDSCQTCHTPEYFSRCHQVEMPHPATFGRSHGQLAVKDRQACASCHKAQSFCDSCHGIQMPHPTGFLKRHSRLATSVRDEACLRCHDAADCSQCHVNHIHPGNAKVSSGIASSPAGGAGQ